MTNILINNLEVQYITKKINNYETMISYFKIIDNDFQKKMKKAFKVSETLRMPYWKTEDDTMMLKVKTANVSKVDLVKQYKYSIDLVLTSYNEADDKTKVKGYTSRINKIELIKREAEEEIDSD